METLNIMRKEYDTWEDAFMGLSPAIRQQSVRVAAYTRVLFVQACATSFGQNISGGAARMNGKYADLAYKCGLYHQLGKALVPEEYQIWHNDFSDEEKALYKKYTTDGRLLVASLQEKTLRAREKRTGKDREYHTDNIPWMMIRESCSQHNERFDGTGYPAGLLGDEISPIAQIVGLAKELDRLSSETKSENPFAEAYDALNDQSGRAFSSQLIEILNDARSKCRAVYNKYIFYTMTVPKTIPLVDKRSDRPMGLSFRPMTDAEGTVCAYEAEMWFGGILGNPAETEGPEDIEQLLSRADIVPDMQFYFLYEAADALLRIKNCKLALDYLVLNMLPAFYKSGSQLQRLTQLLQDQPINLPQLVMTIPQDSILNSTKANEEVIRRYIRNGYNLMVDGWDPEKLSIDRLNDFGFKFVRPMSSLYLKASTAEIFSALASHGITVIAGSVDDHKVMQWLGNCGVKYMCGTLTGGKVNEDEMIRDSLLRERDNG